MAQDTLGIVGTTVGNKYVIERVVGEGSFSIVYRAMHMIWRRPVAIKCFRGLGHVGPEAHEVLVADFIEEGALLSELSGLDATIVQARDVGMLFTPEGEELPYIVLEWLEGQTLDDLLVAQRIGADRHRSCRGLDDPDAGDTGADRDSGGRGQSGTGVRGRWSLTAAMSLLEPVALALDLVHRQGIAHRDIKPGNILVLGEFGRPDARVKLLDFGIAKVAPASLRSGFDNTRAVVSSFTPGYGAPEQFTRKLGVTGPWTDVYSLALVVVELLVGRPPMEGDDVIELGLAAADPVHRPTPRGFGVRVPQQVDDVLGRALAVRSQDRFANAGEFWLALRAAEQSSLLELADLVDPPHVPVAMAARPSAGNPSCPQTSTPRRAGRSSSRRAGALRILGAVASGVGLGIAMLAMVPLVRDCSIGRAGATRVEWAINRLAQSSLGWAISARTAASAAEGVASVPSTSTPSASAPPVAGERPPLRPPLGRPVGPPLGPPDWRHADEWRPAE